MTPLRRSDTEYRSFFTDVYSDALRFAVRRSAAPERAEDAVAEAMLVAWRRFADAPATRDERRAWLFGIVRNTLLNAQRSETRHGALAIRIGESGLAADAPDHAEDVAQRLDLARAWARLDDEQQETLALAVFEQLTAAQSAVVLGISAVAYRARLSRARRALSTHLSHPSTTRVPQSAREATS